MPRLILLVIVLAVGYWLYKNAAGGLFGARTTDSSATAPVDRARAAARTIGERQAETDRLGEESVPREPGRVHENMTPAEVRALMGTPDEVTTGTSATGAPQETWVYRSVGKRVVFENGVAIRVE